MTEPNKKRQKVLSKEDKKILKDIEEFIKPISNKNATLTADSEIEWKFLKKKGKKIMKNMFNKSNKKRRRKKRKTKRRRKRKKRRKTKRRR